LEIIGIVAGAAAAANHASGKTSGAGLIYNGVFLAYTGVIAVACNAVIIYIPGLIRLSKLYQTQRLMVFRPETETGEPAKIILVIRQK